jgi:hypothetical protein
MVSTPIRAKRLSHCQAASFSFLLVRLLHLQRWFGLILGLVLVVIIVEAAMQRQDTAQAQ